MKQAIFSTWDSAIIAGHLAVSQGGLLLQTSIATDNARMARSTASVMQPSNAEFLLYSPDGAKPTLTAHAMMIGIALVSANLNGYVGSDANAYGFDPFDGKLYNNGAAVATFSPATYGDVISVIVVPQGQSLTIMKNGVPIGTYALPTVSSWFFAGTVSGNPGDMGIAANTGATPFLYPLTNMSGWWIPRTTIPPIFLATEPYIALPTDTLANQKFSGDIDRQQSPISVARFVNFWPWGSSKPPGMTSGALAQMDILDPNKIYDYLLTDDVRDLPVTFSRVAQGASLNGAEASYTAIIDHLEQTSDQTKRLYLADKLKLTQSQLVRPLFPPTADPSVAGKPRPVSIGVCRNYAPELYDATNIRYACSDDPIAAFGQTRVNGVVQVYGSPYAITADAEGVQFTTAPTGKLTIESTDIGGSFSASAADILAGAGVFGSITPQPSGTYAGQPTGWQGDGGYYGQDPKSTVMHVVGTAPNETVQQPNNAFAVYTLEYMGGNIIKTGRSFAYSIKFTSVPSYGSGFDPTTHQPIESYPAAISFGWQPNTDNASWIAFQNWAQIGVPTATTYTGVFTNTTNADQPFVIGFLCNGRIAPGGGNYNLASIILQELPPVGQQAALQGATLDQMLQALLIKRGPFSSTDYDPTGAQAIDAATGYAYGLHIKSSETPTVQAKYKEVCDSATADVVELRSGEVTGVRMFAPESYTGSIAGSLTVTDFATYLQQWPDNAENLTNRLSGCRNYDPLTQADFANVTTSQVPLAEQWILKQPYQWTVAGGYELSPRYAHAAQASALGTCLDVQAHGQAEIDRITKIYSVPRNFYVGTVFTPIGRTIEIGDVWSVQYPTGSLVNGQKLLVVGIDEKPSEEITTVYFWGL